VTVIHLHSALIAKCQILGANDLLRELLATVNTLKKDVDELKAKDGERTYPQKLQHNGHDKVDDNKSHDGDNVVEDHDGDLSDTGMIENNGSRFTVSEEGNAFFEATFDSRLKGRIRLPNTASLTLGRLLVPLYLL